MLIVTAFLILFRSSMAYACSCVFPNFEKNLSRSDFVFMATVIPISEGDWNLEIQRVWKGSTLRKGKLLDEFRGSNCAIGDFSKPLVVNVRYIIFARKSKNVNVFYTDACGGIAEADDKLLLKLGKGRPPRRDTSPTR